MVSLDDVTNRRPADPERVAEHKQRMLREIRAYRLRELREASDQTQVQLAAQLHVSQNRISTLERGDIDRTQVGTLRNYVTALGGTLRIEVEIDDQTYVVA